MRQLARCCDWLAVAGFGGLVFVAVLSLIDVGLRTASLPRLPGLNDLLEVALALIVASCFPYGLVKGNNVTVRLLSAVLGPRARFAVELVAAMLVWLFFALAVVSFAAVALELTRAGRSTSTLQLPMAPWLWVMLALLAFAWLVQTALLFGRIAGWRRGGAPAP